MESTIELCVVKLTIVRTYAYRCLFFFKRHLDQLDYYKPNIQVVIPLLHHVT